MGEKVTMVQWPHSRDLSYYVSWEGLLQMPLTEHEG
jgi:hypothetical protein